MQDGFTESFWMHSSEAQSLRICLFSLFNVGFWCYCITDAARWSGSLQVFVFQKTSGVSYRAWKFSLGWIPEILPETSSCLTLWASMAPRKHFTRAMVSAISAMVYVNVHNVHWCIRDVRACLKLEVRGLGWIHGGTLLCRAWIASLLMPNIPSVQSKHHRD